MTLGIHDEWRFERGHFIKQLDSFNCGLIACMKILEMFHLTSDYEVRLAYATNGICNLVVENWRNLIQGSQQDLVVGVRERLTLRTPVAENGDIVLPVCNSSSTTHIGDPVIAAAARDSALAEIDHCGCIKKNSNVPAHAFATEIVRETQTTVNELSVLDINFLLIMNSG